MTINKFIYSIDDKTFEKIRNSQSDAECRRYLLEIALTNNLPSSKQSS